MMAFAITMGAKIILLWLVVMVIGLGGIFVMVLWAVRTRQFSNQERARYLPLDSYIPEDDATDDERADSRENRT
jgi:cbb3-type cytochrome oxidase maturation protein